MVCYTPSEKNTTKVFAAEFQKKRLLFAPAGQGQLIELIRNHHRPPEGRSGRRGEPEQTVANEIWFKAFPSVHLTALEVALSRLL